jgi:ATP phosphoribosyltransferase
MKKPLTIAIQKKGKLTQPSLDYLRTFGIEETGDGTELIVRDHTTNSRLIFVRDDDIPAYVATSTADIGIVGENVAAEKGLSKNIRARLGFGKCRLAIAVPNGSPIVELSGLNGERIATSYPVLLSTFLKRHHINAVVIEISGSVEIAPEIGLTDAICDLVDTGKTLTEHGLHQLTDIMSFEAVVVAKNPHTLDQLKTLRVKAAH